MNRPRIVLCLSSMATCLLDQPDEHQPEWSHPPTVISRPGIIPVIPPDQPIPPRSVIVSPQDDPRQFDTGRMTKGR
jgi:hypothetical protein